MALPILPALVQQLPASNIWEALYWSVEARGPLLAIEIESWEPLPNLPEAALGVQNAAELLTRYDATLVRCGGITVATARTMRLYDPPRVPVGLSEKLRDVAPNTYLYMLLDSLSSGQEQQLFSERGLALGALDPRQSRWLQENILPESATFRLPQAAEINRQTLRVRLSRQLAIQVTGRGGQGSPYTPTGLPPLPAASVSLALRDSLPVVEDDERLLGYRRVLGKNKPTDLAPSASSLDAIVSLEGCATVKALIARLAQATRLPLFADAALAGKSVRVRGTKARAGDVLQALCRGVNGGMRQVGSVYLLVEDLPSAAERRERANADYQRFLRPQEQETQQLSQLAAAARRRLSRQGGLARVPRSRQDAPEALWSLAERFDTEGHLAFSQLTETLKREVLTRFEQQKAQTEEIGGLAVEVPAEATAEQTLVMELLAPDVQGVAEVVSFPIEPILPEEPLGEPIGPIVIPETLSVRAWQVALPEDDGQQESLLALAKRGKITQLRVPFTPQPGSEARLAALAHKAKALGIGVVPVLSPFMALTPSASRERNAMGLTLKDWVATFAAEESPSSRLARGLARWDFLVPEALDTSAFVALGRHLVALSGITGLALDSVSVPGYPDVEVGDWSLWIGGLALESRVTFLRTHQTDPADLIAASPFDLERSTPERNRLRELWETQQRQRRDRALARLNTALQQAKFPWPLSVREGSLGKSGSWRRWRGVVPGLEESEESASSGLLHVSLLAYDAKVSGLVSSASGLLSAEARLREWLDLELQPATRPTPDHPDHWDGFVVDVSDRPLTAALTLLEQAFIMAIF
ncbi:MAG: hypothetical protein NTX57_01020 [Armatimonadetes bacterium]|nr:hypothetical protein [Armatimonadota bacterium]